MLAKKKRNTYRDLLSTHRDRRLILLQNSGLPGRRANIELAEAFAETAGKALILNLASISADEAPRNSPKEFLAFCGVLGLGRLAVEKKEKSLDKLREAASDKRWRIREAVAMALQTIGYADMDSLLDIASEWNDGNFFEKRAAVAGISEPKLLTKPGYANPVLGLMDSATYSLQQSDNRKTPGYDVLKKGLGYTWSVGVSAYPTEGKPLLEKWAIVSHPDIQWIVKKTLKKKRLQKVDPDWVKSVSSQL